LIQFSTFDIDSNTTDKEVNQFLATKNPTMMFIMDVGPNHKRLWVSENIGPVPKDKNLN
jgi:hypothetical protein